MTAPVNEDEFLSGLSFQDHNIMHVDHDKGNDWILELSIQFIVRDERLFTAQMHLYCSLSDVNFCFRFQCQYMSQNVHLFYASLLDSINFY